MKAIKGKITLIIYIVSMLIPYLTVIFFIRTASIFAILPVFPIALFALLVSTSALIHKEPENERKKYYRITACLAVVCFFLTYDFQLRASDWVFFKIRERKLTTFIYELKKNGKINEMSDGLRYWKSVNDVSIEPNMSDVDTSKTPGRKYFLDDVLKEQSIEKTHYEALRSILVETNLISVTTLEDGTISFTIDGFLDNCYGIAYSGKGINPGSNDCGDIIVWNKLAENWYAWATT